MNFLIRKYKRLIAKFNKKIIDNLFNKNFVVKYHNRRKIKFFVCVNC